MYVDGEGEGLLTAYNKTALGSSSHMLKWTGIEGKEGEKKVVLRRKGNNGSLWLVKVKDGASYLVLG